MTLRQLSLWNRLRLRIIRASKAFGSQAEIARALGVSRQVLNTWLSGAALPTAENTLQLLQWVEAEEAKKQKSNPGRVRPRPGRKTQKRKSKSK
jgi:transcriptional regulator with XRE-family HTH domain